MTAKRAGLVLLGIALASGILGFGGIAGPPRDGAKIVCVVSFAAAVMALVISSIQSPLWGRWQDRRDMAARQKRRAARDAIRAGIVPAGPAGGR